MTQMKSTSLLQASISTPQNAKPQKDELTQHLTDLSVPKDHPGVKIPPPLIVAVILGLSMWINYRLVSTLMVPHWALSLLGWGLCLLAGGLSLWCFYLYRRYATNIIPHTPDSYLITEGPFSYSRNPIYLAFILGYLGICLVYGAILACLGVIGVYWALKTYVIKREEAYLIRKFGAAYMAYMSLTPRWL